MITVNPGTKETGCATQDPQWRWVQPEDAARLFGWLATDDGQWITCRVITSTGGGP